MQTLDHKLQCHQPELWLEEKYTTALLKHLESKIGHSFVHISSTSLAHYALFSFFDENTKTPVHVKLYPRQNAQANKHYLSETSIGSLKHPGVTPLIFFEDQVGFPTSLETTSPALTVVEAPLFDTLNEVYLINETASLIDEKLSRTFFKQIVSALEFLHSKEVHHTNLSLESIFLTDDFVLKLGDFHNCVTPGQKYLSHHGTKDFRAPEVCQGQAKDFSKADIYSLGIILFVLRYDSLPYTEEEPDDMVTNLFWGNPNKFWSKEYLGVVDQGFRELFESMVNLDHDQRATLAEVKSCQWYNGEVYTDEEVVAIMRKVI